MFAGRDDWSGYGVAVFGLGKTGAAALEYFASRGARVLAVDSAELDEKSELFERFSPFGERVQFFLGGRQPADWRGIDLAVLSPGIDPNSPMLEGYRASGKPLRGALDLAVEIAQKPVIAVTGTAGKSTTVSLLGEIFQAEGIPAFVGGNLGTPLFQWLHRRDEAELLILECSSFQLELAKAIRARIAVLTNFSPNHLDRHGTMEEYARCKARLFQLMPEDSHAIGPAGDESSLRIVRNSPGKLAFFSESPAEGVHAWDNGPSFSLEYPGFLSVTLSWEGFQLRGGHNRLNALAAALAAYLWGVSSESIRRGLTNFRGLPHRLQYLGTIEGVAFYDDSKATTPEAVLRSVRSFGPGEPIHLLLGGKAKSRGFSVLASELGRRVKGVYLFGSSAGAIREELNLSESSVFSDLEEAFIAALRRAEGGEVVLLSPGCASFDQYKNFVERGLHFQSLVENVKSK